MSHLFALIIIMLAHTANPQTCTEWRQAGGGQGLTIVVDGVISPRHWYCRDEGFGIRLAENP